MSADCPRCGERTTHPNDAFDVLGMAKRIQQLEAALKRCAQGAFIMEQRGELINIAKQALDTALRGTSDG